MERDLLLDSSVAISLLSKDDELHDACRAVTDGARLGLSGHAVFETLSTISRMPGSRRKSVHAVYAAIQYSFPHSRFLSASAAKTAAADIARLGVSGGAIYDALVAATAIEHGLPLVTRDMRAMRTYKSMGADVIAVS